MISRVIFRAILVVVAFFVAALASLAVLFGLGAIWAGDELRAAAPHDPLVRDGAPIFGMMLFAGTVGPALTALPAMIAVVAGEVLRVRSWMYYVLAGGVSLASIPNPGSTGRAAGGRCQPRHDDLCHRGVRRRLCLLAARRSAGLGDLSVREIERGDPCLQGKPCRRPRLRQVFRYGLTPSFAAAVLLEPGHKAIGGSAALALGVFTRALASVLEEHWFRPSRYTARATSQFTRAIPLRRAYLPGPDR